MSSHNKHAPAGFRRRRCLKLKLTYQNSTLTPTVALWELLLELPNWPS